MVAEDEPLVRTFLLQGLRVLGYRPLVATDGQEAWALWQHHRGEIDLVLTDLSMPRLNGHDLIERLLADAAPPLVVACSGELDELAIVRRRWRTRIPVLEKPFHLRELGDILQLATDGRSDADTGAGPR